MGSWFVVRLFDNGQTALLNRLSGAGSGGGQSLEFYLGRLQDNIFGPAEQVAASLALAVMGLGFFLDARRRTFFALIFLFLLVTKAETLTYPCYGEMGAGPFAEAVWLARHSFDYAGLMQQPNFSGGGAKVYLFSIYPTLVAVLLKAVPSGKTFLVVYRLLTFATAAVAATLFREILRRKFEDRDAILLTALLVSLPLFQSMTELMNMETLCLVFVVMSAYFLVDKRIVPASVAAVLAAFAKGPGGIACSSVFVVSLYLFFFDPQSKHQKGMLLWGTGALLLGTSVLALFRIFVMPEQMPAGTIRFMVGLDRMLKSRFLVLGYGLFLVSAVSALIREWRHGAETLTPINQWRDPWAPRLGAFVEQHYVFAVAFVMVSSWFGVYLSSSVLGPRYQLILAPFFLICLAYPVLSLLPSQRAKNVVLLAAIMLSALGSYGLYCPEKFPSGKFSFNHLERTLEYRNDLKLFQDLARTLERDYPGWTVGAPHAVAQMLAMPELGYVHRPLDVVLYGMRVHYGGIRNFDGLDQLDPARTIWVGFEGEQIISGVEFPIDSHRDRVVRRLTQGDKKVALFRGGYAIEKMRRLILMYYHQKNLEKVRAAGGGEAGKNVQ